jgi:hypothetical protein
MSKVDPRKLSKLDRKTSILLQAAREHVGHDDNDPEKAEVEAVEEPGYVLPRNRKVAS